MHINKIIKRIKLLRLDVNCFFSPIHASPPAKLSIFVKSFSNSKTNNRIMEHSVPHLVVFSVLGHLNRLFVFV